MNDRARNTRLSRYEPVWPEAVYRQLRDDQSAYSCRWPRGNREALRAVAIVPLAQGRPDVEAAVVQAASLDGFFLAFAATYTEMFIVGLADRHISLGEPHFFDLLEPGSAGQRLRIRELTAIVDDQAWRDRVRPIGAEPGN